MVRTYAAEDTPAESRSTSALRAHSTGDTTVLRIDSRMSPSRFRQAIDRARTRYVPGLVLAEVDYFLPNERAAMNAFMNDLAAGRSRVRRRPSISSREPWRLTVGTPTCVSHSARRRGAVAQVGTWEQLGNNSAQTRCRAVLATAVEAARSNHLLMMASDTLMPMFTRVSSALSSSISFSRHRAT